jgi:uncharacterized OB-fold protein
MNGQSQPGGENHQEFTAAAFQAHLNDQKLMGSRCQSCGSLHLPPRALCPDCYGGAVQWEEVGKQGKLVALTVIHIAPTAMIDAGYGRDNPYCTGIVQLEDGPAVSAQIVGVDPAKPESIRIGRRVKLAFVKRGEGDEAPTYLAFEPDG